MSFHESQHRTRDRACAMGCSPHPRFRGLLAAGSGVQRIVDDAEQSAPPVGLVQDAFHTRRFQFVEVLLLAQARRGDDLQAGVSICAARGSVRRRPGNGIIRSVSTMAILWESFRKQKQAPRCRPQPRAPGNRAIQGPSAPHRRWPVRHPRPAPSSPSPLGGAVNAAESGRFPPGPRPRADRFGRWSPCPAGLFTLMKPP